MKTTTYQTPPQHSCHAILQRPSLKLHDWNSDSVCERILEEGYGHRVGVTALTSRRYCRPRHLHRTLWPLLKPAREGPEVSFNSAGAKGFHLKSQFPNLADRSPEVYYSYLWVISSSDNNPGGV
jgi:hypothetical protein